MSLSPIPRGELHLLFFEIAAVIANTKFVNQTLPNAIAFTYGQLKLSIVGYKDMTWESVRSAVDQVKALVVSGALEGFFELYIECMRGAWMWIVFGIPLYIYTGRKGDVGH